MAEEGEEGRVANPPPAPVMRKGLAELVVDYLLHEISEGFYPPDGRLPAEPVLAELTGVSRPTLREAIKSLEQRGVVRVEQGRGTFVNPSSRWLLLDPQLLDRVVRRDRAAALQLTEVKQIIEVGGAALAAQRRRPSDLAAMHEALQRMIAARDEKDPATFACADIGFHQAVLAAADNPFLPALLAPIDTGLRGVRTRTAREPHMNQREIDLHTEVYEAIRNRSAEVATGVMGRHLEEAREYIGDLEW